MTLTNYWWLLIWLFVGGALLAFLVPKRRELVCGKVEERWRVVPAVILVAPYIIWAGFRADGFGDTAAYRANFLGVPSQLGELPEYLETVTKDRGFTVLSVLLKTIIGNSDVAFFLIIAAFQILCLALVYRKYSSNYWLSLFMFVVSTDYLSWVHNGMRQFIAVMMIFACFHLLVKKKYVPLICVILLASTIHGSALLMIPVIFIVQGKAWNKKTIFFIVVIAIIMAFIDRFTPLLDDMLAETQYSDLVTNEIWTNDDGTSILRVLVYSAPALLSLLGKRYIDATDDPVINICVNCSCVTMALYFLASISSGIYIGRLPIYTTLQGYIAVPWLIDHMFTKDSTRLVKVGMIGAFLVFFYYQMHMTWAIL